MRCQVFVILKLFLLVFLFGLSIATDKVPLTVPPGESSPDTVEAYKEHGAQSHEHRRTSLPY